MPAVVNGLSYTRAQAIKSLFGIRLNDDLKFKTKLTTLEGKGESSKGVLCIAHDIARGGKGSRGKRRYLPEHLNRLHNIVLISGFFPKPAIIKEVADNLVQRIEHVAVLRRLIGSRESVGDIQFNRLLLGEFLNCLESGTSLDKERFPNPFIKLPQVINNGTGSYPTVWESYHSKSVATSDIEEILLAYLDLDIEKAHKLASELGQVKGYASQLKTFIAKEYRNAVRVDNDLEGFLISAF